jgi:hypothetical protein
MLDEAPAPPARPAGEYDVELVPVPLPGATPEPLIAPRPGHGDDRPLTDLHRRDFIMLGAGGGGVLLAILGGYGLAQAFRRKKEPVEPEKPKDKPE